MHALLNAEWITVHGLVSMLAVAIFAIGARARGERRHPSAAMAWVISLALMPYVAIPSESAISRTIARLAGCALLSITVPSLATWPSAAR